MNTLPSSLRASLAWLPLFALLAVLLLWQTDWGRAFARTPAAEAAPTPQPLTLALLPEYQPPSAPGAATDMVERTLFNPTRRPAPAQAPEAAKPRIQRGQFTLAGTLVVDGKAIAYLKEVNGGKQRRVVQGETVNGMLVAEVKADRVRLTAGDESEDLGIKLATGPRTTIQPVVPPSPGAVSATAPPKPAAGSATQPAAIPQARDVAEILAERRRAARAAELAAQGQPPGTPLPQANLTAPITAPIPPPPTVDPNAGDPRWQQMYQRYRQPRQ